MDKKDALKQVSENGMDLKNLPEKFKKDKEIVLKAVSNDGVAIQFAIYHFLIKPIF